MAFINKHDTNGTKGLLAKGELGYDDYTAGGDTGRVYVGTSTENIALAERLESNMMTKAQFNALAEERKANRAGSGFDSFGWGSISNPSTDYIINEGMWVRNTLPNNICSSRSDAATKGTSKSKIPIVNINGVQHKFFDNGGDRIPIPTAPNIYPYNTVLTAEQIASGVIKHADASNSGLVVMGKNLSGTTFNQTVLVVNGKKYLIEYKDNGVRKTLEITASSTSYIISLSGTNITEVGMYPADAISRSDLVFLESWHEDISEKNFVYPLGNVQYLGGNTDGLTGIANGVFTGVETYSLQGNWQTPSALIGKGYVWSSLTEAQKKAFIANPENNCYLDGDKVIQVRYRVRVVQGWGDDWGFGTDVTRSYIAPDYGRMCFGHIERSVKVKGKLTNVLDISTRTGNEYTAIPQGNFSPIGQFTNYVVGGTSPDTGSAVAYEGKCFALPIALVHRRNQGMYHNVYNPNGTKLASDGLDCFTTTISFNSAMDCFDPAKLLTASGYIGTVSGRPDGLFYDQVDEGGILDLRNSSTKVEDYSRLISREFKKLVDGTNRGKECENNIISMRTFTKTSSFGTDKNRFYFVVSPTNYPQLTFNPVEDNSYYLVGSNGSVYFAKQVINQSATGLLYVPFGTTYVYIPIDGKNTVGTMNTLFPDGTTITVIVVKRTTRTKSNTLLHCDIIGNPTNYPTAWKQSGVFGTPLIVAEDGTSLLPNGVLDTFKLSRKANATPLLCLRSTDSGATWTSFTPTFNTTLNVITLTNEPATNLVMVYYQTHTNMAVPVVNSEVLEIGDVYASCHNSKLIGNDLCQTLISKISVNTGDVTFVSSIKVPNTLISNSGKTLFAISNTYNNIHSMISLQAGAPVAVKVFPYLTRLNGKAYLNLVFKEMKYGSYLAPTVVTAGSATYTQNMTYKINLAGCALDGKVIKWIGTTATSAIDWSLYDVSPTGVIYLLSTGVVDTNAKLYDGDSWGDSNKFEIVDNVSTTIDDNAQTVLIGQKGFELPYFLGADE